MLSDHEIDASWEPRERVVVALTGRPEGATLIRRASRIAARGGGAELVAVHVASSDGRARADSTELAEQRALTESLGGSYHVVRGSDPANALVEFARGVNATQLVLGASRRRPIVTRFTGSGIGARAVQLSGDIDVHIISHEHAGGRRKTPSAVHARALWPSWQRSLFGFMLAAALLTAATGLLAADRQHLNLLSAVLVYLLAIVVIALAAGLLIATASAVVASLMLNYFFTQPLHRFAVREPNDALALVVFVFVAVVVSVLVDRAERRRREAAQASAEAETLATVAGSVLRGESALPALLEQLREIFGMRAVTLLERADGSWRTARSVGERPASMPQEGDVVVPADESTSLVLSGPVLGADDQRVLRAFAIQAAAALRTERLAAEAEQSRPLREVDRTRTALLAAVSHDLRTPLAGAKAAVSSLRDPSVVFSEEDRSELLATAEESLDRLTKLVENLLDMSRLQAGVMAAHCQEVDIDDVAARALDSLGPSGDHVKVTVPAGLPSVSADPGLLERVFGNLLENALRVAPPDQPTLLLASTHRDRIEVRIVDHGPGLAQEAKERVFLPFQRLGDTSNTTGVGLGLALARGFAEAMGGSLTPEETPGGGLTMVVTLNAAGDP
jgi:two-component system sensor histidine kinase KdpD